MTVGINFSKQARRIIATGLVLAVTGCIGQLPNMGGVHPAVRKPTSGEVSDCKHIRNLHDLFSISSAGLAFASGASGLSTIVLDSSRGKNALAITSVILGVLGAVATAGTSIETNHYLEDYPSQGGCPAILGLLGDGSSGDSGSPTP